MSVHSPGNVRQTSARREKRRRWLVAATGALCVLVLAVLVAPGLFQTTNPAQPNAGVPNQQMPTSNQDSPAIAQDSEDESSTQQGPAQSAAPREIDDPNAFDGAAYESGTVLVDLAEGVSAQEAADALAEAAGGQFGVISATDSYVKLGLPDNLSVADALYELSEVDAIAGVQPNFQYFLADSVADSMSQTAATPDQTANPDSNSTTPDQTANPDSDSTTPVGAHPVRPRPQGAQTPSDPDSTSSDSGQDVIPTPDPQDAPVRQLLLAATSAALTAQAADAPDAQALAVQSTNDPSVGSQWALESINAFDAWELAQSNRNVTVAVVDNMFNLGHEDLADNIVAPYNAVSQRENDDMSAKNYAGNNPIGHGTHVAGIVAAAADNAKGVAGTSYNAQIMPVRVEDDEGVITTEYLVNAYEYILSHAAEHNVRVINLSIGAGRNDLSWDSTDRKLFAEIDRAYSQGIVTVTAACNAGGGYSPPFYCFPGDYDKCVNVININSSLARSPSSNYNRGIQRSKDISAPGTEILSATMTNTQNPRPDTYSVMSGTSMAAPCVSGVLALMFTMNPGLSASEATSKLYSTAVDLNEAENIGSSAFDAQTGWGEVDAFEAVADSEVLLAGELTVQAGKSTRLWPKPSQTGDWQWESDDPSVATVSNGSAAGVTVTGRSAGTALITADNGKGSQAVAAVSVYDPVITGDLQNMAGATARLSISSKPTGVWNWTSSDPSIAAVRSTTGSGCTVSCRRAGTATITATLASNSAIQATVQLGVVDDVASAELRNVYDLVCTGEPLEHADMQVVLGGTTLVSGQDYTVSYRDNVETGVGAVTVVGRGQFIGTKTKQFRIGAASIEDAQVEGIGPMVYTGQNITLPDLKLTLDEDVLVPNVDYTVLYEKNLNVGVAYVHISGKGNYVGELSYAFEIQPASINDALVTTHAVKDFTGSAVRTTTIVSLNGHTLASPFDYRVDYADNVNAGTAHITVTGLGNYCGTAHGSFTIRPASLESADIVLPSNTFTYTGSPIQPEPSVYLSHKALHEGIDYQVEWKDNVNTGTATITVTGMGNYEGEIARSFTITPAPMSAVTISGITDQYYTGREITPRPQIAYNGITVRRSADYQVEYSDNVNRGTATVKITGQGNYAGTETLTFNIVDRPVYRAGATQMTAGSASEWVLRNCSLEVVSGESIVRADGATVTALAPGTATVAVVDLRNITLSTYEITVS